MKIFRPRTFLNLVLLGFVAVSVPLGVGLWTTLTYIEEVTGTGLEVVDHSVSGTRDSEILSEYLRNEERTLRLYSITSEVEYLKQAQTYHNQIDSLLFELLSLPLEYIVRKDIEETRSSRNLLRTVIIEALSKPGDETLAEIKVAIESFSNQYDRAMQIRTGIRNMVESEVDGLKTTTAEAQHALVSQTITFILATIFMIAIMAFLLSWPVRQLNKSVERLGRGDFKTPVLVTGPLDVEAVGEKLDWLRKRLDALEQEKSKFLAHISHELKTPLASIREGASLLNEELVGDLNDKQQEVASILVNNSILLQGLIENIIDFNMAQAGQKLLDISPVDFKALLEKVAQAQTAKMIGREIQLDLKLEEATVYGDCKQLETIFENLFSNAVKFSPQGGTVGCRLNGDRKSVACIVFDSGPGIAIEEKDKIFQPFYQVETSTSTVVKGSGLGLAIVKEYVKYHHGTLSLLNPGKPGARFGVTLPRRRESKKKEV
jgi:two-component system sensor histidine kinase GlrK